jgi:hypothetical protein
VNGSEREKGVVNESEREKGVVNARERENGVVNGRGRSARVCPKDGHKYEYQISNEDLQNLRNPSNPITQI